MVAGRIPSGCTQRPWRDSVVGVDVWACVCACDAVVWSFQEVQRVLQHVGRLGAFATTVGAGDGTRYVRQRPRGDVWPGGSRK